VGEVWIYGLHPALAALRNPLRKILRIVATKEVLARLHDAPDVPPALLGRVHASGRHEIDALVGPAAVHQGIAVLARALEANLADVLEQAENLEQACIVVLDQVTDPHNVGAILRSAAAFGALAVIAPDRGAPDESGAMAKSASGALDVIPYIKGVNLVRMLEDLMEQRFWLVGLNADAPAELSEIDLKGRIALVVGAEGEGLRRLVAETCDHMAKLPMTGATESLNVSNAAAVALYEWTRQTRTSS
jgi:23S rRNA (guanosine2251-2'-O)-methyltransferase